MRDDEQTTPLNPFVRLLDVPATASATAGSVLSVQSNVRQQRERAHGTVQLIHTRRVLNQPAAPSLDVARDALKSMPGDGVVVPRIGGWRRRASRLIGFGTAVSAAAAAMMWVNITGPASAVVTQPVTEVAVSEAAQPPMSLARAEPVDDLGQSVYAAYFAAAPAHERKCLARALYYEARGESYEGQIAVAQVIVNRVRLKGWPDSICGVVQQGIERGEKCQFSFVCHAPAVEPTGVLWDKAKELADDVVAGRAWLREAADATHYHTVNVAPVWRSALSPIRTIGSHIFYRESGEMSKDTKSYNPLAALSLVAVPVKRPRPAARGAGGLGGENEGNPPAASITPFTITATER